MAVDPKTGKPVSDCWWSEIPPGLWAGGGDHPLPPPPDADPRGVSPLRGAYGLWLAAQEMRREMGGRP